jgi:hypothetical protein
MDRRGQRLAVVFVVGLLVFNYPLMSLASTDTTLFGIPVLYLYLFGSWALIVGTMALIIERRR